MMQLNLLPWRQHRKKIKKLRFACGAIIAGIVSLFILVVSHHIAANALNEQQSKNDFIQSEINKEKAVLAGLIKEKGKHVVYEKQIRMITNIKQVSYNTISLLKILPTLGTSSIFIMNISRVGNLITITGKAQSNEQITQLLANIASQSSIFNEPSLGGIKNDKNTSKEAGYFELKIVQKDINSSEV